MRLYTFSFHLTLKFGIFLSLELKRYFVDTTTGIPISQMPEEHLILREEVKFLIHFNVRVTTIQGVIKEQSASISDAVNNNEANNVLYRAIMCYKSIFFI